MTFALAEAAGAGQRDALIFDCDGVLLVSNTLKQRVFCETLAACGFTPETTRRFSAFQSARFGLSRYKLFEELLTWDDPAARRVTQQQLLDDFGMRVRAGYFTTPATPGLRDVIGAMAARFDLYIVSGSDQAELRDVLAARDWGARFRLVLGSPTSKIDNIAQILGALPAQKRAVAFVGDAEADFNAAAHHAIPFVYMRRYSTAKPRMEALRTSAGFEQIDDLRALPDTRALKSLG